MVRGVFAFGVNIRHDLKTVRPGKPVVHPKSVAASENTVYLFDAGMAAYFLAHGTIPDDAELGR